VNRLCRCSLALQFFVAAYLCAAFKVLPVPKYYPTLHLWTTDSIEKQPAMSWYGYTVYGLAAAVVGYLLGVLYARLQERLKFDLAVPSACVAGLVFVVCIVLHEAHRWL